METNEKIPQPTLEQKLQLIAERSQMNLTIRDLKDLVFQHQKAENKSLKDMLDAVENEQRRQQIFINDKRLRNEAMRLDLEHADLEPLFKLLQQKKYPPKKKKFLLF
jgi:hypothetical protein